MQQNGDGSPENSMGYFEMHSCKGTVLSSIFLRCMSGELGSSAQPFMT
jgi:hypothetical protein